ncbi:MAG: DPP IV N-terminal domain-containing protein [Anaerolineales bacterium]|nr:DPP IV N-terminal domain-containing protein [Anaerolineales bacterium]
MKLKSLIWMPLTLSLAALACSVFSPAATATPSSLTAAPIVTDTPAAPVATDTAAPAATDTLSSPTETVAPAPTDTPAAPPAQQFIAYVDPVRNLLVTNVTGDVLGGTTQYTQIAVEGQALDLAWSPSGEYVGFVTSRPDNVHVYYVYAVGAGTPVDLGIGADVAWSPDSAHIAFVRDGNLWQYSLETGAAQPLTFNDSTWAWGRPVYSPDGAYLIAAGALYADLGAQGNTAFWLYQIPVDGSSAPAPLPGMAGGPQIEGRLARDLTFSPDGARLAFTTSWHISACASAADYHVLNADGSGLRSVVSPSLAALADSASEKYFLGFSLAWTPDSAALLQTGEVRNCANFEGALVGGPQLSRVGLDGAETLVAAGNFDSLSFDRSGTRIGLVARPDAIAPGEVRLYNLAGFPVLTIGPGDLAALQP